MDLLDLQESPLQIGGALDKITAGAVDSLDEISGFDVKSLGAAIDNITGGATAALGDIEVTGFSRQFIAMVEKVTSGATSLGQHLNGGLLLGQSLIDG